MTNTRVEAIEGLIEANKILVAQSVLDAFGHVSVRNPDNADSYFLSRSLAPELVTAQDIIEYDLDCVPVTPSDVAVCAENLIRID